MRQSVASPVVTFLLVANILIHFLAEMGAFETLVRWFALWPPGAAQATMGASLIGVHEFHLWQLLSYGFLHGSLGHLFFNMFALWMFGTQLERLWGSPHFLLYYIVCVIGAGLIQLGVAAVEGFPNPTLGASGGVFGLLLAYGMMFPENRLVLLFPPLPFPLKAKWFVLFYGLVELGFGVAAPHSGVAHFAHLGGMAFGFMLILYWRGRFPLKPKYILRR